MSQPWPESLYREAIIILNAEAGYKVTQEEVDEEAEKRRRAMPTTGFVAGRDFNFWSKCIKDGVLDEAAAMSRGLTAEQLPSKRAEMEALGWLVSEDERTTQPMAAFVDIPEDECPQN